MNNHVSSNQLLSNLSNDVRRLIQISNTYFIPQERNLLNQKHPNEDWSVADCIEHLNEFCQYYIPKLETIVERGINENIPSEELFTSNQIGAEAIISVHPQNLPTMQTMGHFKGREIGGKENSKVFVEFEEFQKRLVIILNKAKNTSLTALGVPVRNKEEWELQLGDCLQYIIAHQILHTLQAMKLLEELTATTQKL